MDSVQALLAEQIEYYRHRAAEYEETARPPGDSLASNGHELVAALGRSEATGNVLEIASGTGAWTTQILKHASSVAALDSAPEMHAQAAVRVSGDRRVRLLQADVFSWTPDHAYDVVFFANWLSHVPLARFGTFWRTVRAHCGRRGESSSSTSFATPGDRSASTRTSPPPRQTPRSSVGRCSMVAASEWSRVLG
jgi:demethylmenaquinone methyltransferase/2-methoxy-6-polyprenyl-1,4-benzoquinol methylase